jgi:lambda family phage tail tape measure protein
MSLLARLGVVLGLNSTEFTQGLDQATKKTREFEINQKRALKNAAKAQDEAMANMAKGFGLLAAAGVALGSAFKYADEIVKTAKAYDTTTESLMAMQEAFKASGGETEMAGNALNKLAMSQQNAIDGSDALREAFTKLGISGKDVEELSLPELFKRVTQELSKVENATQRTALQQELLGKAVKGTNWKEFVSNYKEVADPSLARAIEENAKAWGNIEIIFKGILDVIQKMVSPFAMILNHIMDIGDEWDRLKKGGSNEVDFGVAFGGMPGEAIVGQYGDVPKPSNPIAKEAKTGKYSKDTDKQKAEAKKAADEARRIAEARANLKTEIDLLQTKASLQAKMFAVDSKGITLGQAAISQEKMMLDLANDIATIRANANKERQKDKAQIDLINEKEKQQIDARVAEFGYANGLRMQQRKREHELAMQSIHDENDATHHAQTVQALNELTLLEVEADRFKLGVDAYELAKSQVEENNALRNIHLETAAALKQVTREYELSAQTAEDLELYEANIAKIRGEGIRQLHYTVMLENKKRDNLKEQQEFQKRIFAMDLAQQKGRDIANIQSQLAIDKDRLGLEYRRFMLTQNQYNLQSLQLENINRLVEAEKKYNDQMKEAKYEMERQGGGQRAREQYEQRIKSITEVRDVELEAIKQVNDARTRNAEADVMRQKSFTEGWEYAARRFREDAENAFNRGQAAFGAVMSNMDAALSNFVETGKFKFEDFAYAVIKDLIRIELQAQATMLLRMVLGSFSGMSLSSPNVDAGISGNVGMAAAGGEIDGPTIVGENGPELFIPAQRGTVIPNTMAPSMAGMGQPQVVYNGPYIENMSAIDTQSAAQFLSKNKMSVWAANKSANRSVPVSR